MHFILICSHYALWPHILILGTKWYPLEILFFCDGFNCYWLFINPPRRHKAICFTLSTNTEFTWKAIVGNSKSVVIISVCLQPSTRRLLTYNKIEVDWTKVEPKQSYYNKWQIKPSSEKKMVVFQNNDIITGVSFDFSHSLIVRKFVKSRVFYSENDA